jgi:hypothetical protein
VTDEDAIVEREAGLRKAQTRGQITMGLGGRLAPASSWLCHRPRHAGSITTAIAAANKTIIPREHSLPPHVGRRSLPGSPGGTMRPTCGACGLASALRNAASTCWANSEDWRKFRSGIKPSFLLDGVEPVLNRCKRGKSIEDGRKLFTDYRTDHIEVVTVHIASPCAAAPLPS